MLPQHRVELARHEGREGFDTMRNGFLPRWDRAYSALIEDLDQRGLLDSTMVLAWGEFGRTPKVNDKAGRDHWPNVFSAAIAGGGIQGGAVHGASDRLGAQPKEGLVRPEDITATLFHCLGLTPDTEIQDIQGRSLVISQGQVLRQILA